jgi:hypothetical protein
MKCILINTPWSCELDLSSSGWGPLDTTFGSRFSWLARNFLINWQNISLWTRTELQIYISLVSKRHTASCSFSYELWQFHPQAGFLHTAVAPIGSSTPETVRRTAASNFHWTRDPRAPNFLERLFYNITGISTDRPKHSHIAAALHRRAVSRCHTVFLLFCPSNTLPLSVFCVCVQWTVAVTETPAKSTQPH